MRRSQRSVMGPSLEAFKIAWDTFYLVSRISHVHQFCIYHNLYNPSTLDGRVLTFVRNLWNCGPIQQRVRGNQIEVVSF